jgi:hypothetical protein
MGDYHLIMGSGTVDGGSRSEPSAAGFTRLFGN